MCQLKIHSHISEMCYPPCPPTHPPPDSRAALLLVLRLAGDVPQVGPLVQVVVGTGHALVLLQLAVVAREDVPVAAAGQAHAPDPLLVGGADD